MGKVDNNAPRPVERKDFLGGGPGDVQGQLGGRTGCRERGFAQLGGSRHRNTCAADQHGGDSQLKDLLYHGVR
jgi:hypothetical protein